MCCLVFLSNVLKLNCFSKCPAVKVLYVKTSLH
uniref:Uncharacterized protein n=1 Tax=Anguilla anguilla TaxID=7936 RepID=A0A0E9XSR2_ANGAN